MNIEETQVMKNGVEEVIAKVNVKRTPNGLLVAVRTHAVIEEMFKGFSNGELNAANSHGRLWSPSTKERKLPHCYALGNMVGGMYVAGEFHYTLDTLGGPIYSDRQVNLSFLRFVGVSNEEGVSFLVKGVYSLDMLERMVQGIKTSISQVYLDFIKPIDYVITITSAKGV